MSLPKAALLALCVALPGVSSDALAQSQSEYWGKPADFKPLLPPIIPPLLPPRSTLTPGSGSGDAPSSYSSNPAWDAARSAPAPGLRLTIPSR